MSFTALGDYLTVIVTLNDCSKRISYGGRIEFSTHSGILITYVNLDNYVILVFVFESPKEPEVVIPIESNFELNLSSV